MGNTVINKDILFPEEVRNILNTDNDEIKRLCKQVNVFPKRDSNSGRTFFMKNDVEVLKSIKDLHEKGLKIANNSMNTDKKIELPTEIKKNSHQSLNIQPEIKSLASNIIEAQEKIVDKLAKIIDEKLEGLDEVIVELIRCKTENENLRVKLNELTKDNYSLQKDMDSYKPVGLGLFIKK